MCYYNTAIPRFHMSERRKTYEMRLPCRYISFFPYYLSVLSRKLEALMFTTGAFFWDYSGIGILGIYGVCVLLGAIPFSE